jgi:gluconate 2-dehydrogenase gamma chain
MDRAQPTRREFVSTSAGLLGGGWLWLQLPAITSLSACARDAARDQAPFRLLSGEQAAAMRAFAARILPSGDGLPGAEEAGAVYFVDGALGGLFAEMKEPVLAGLADLDARARTAHRVTFAAATPEQQDAIITAVSEAPAPFFFMARLLTVAGVFADPSYGGNRNHAGATILGMEHTATYQPPFGWYDAEYAKGGVA